jgi:hypothetical protein
MDGFLGGYPLRDMDRPEAFQRVYDRGDEARRG